MNDQWNINQIPDLSGKNVIITGANSGLGLSSAMVLAKKNATVILACRNIQKGNIAFNNIKLQYPKAKLELLKLDLSSRKSIERFVEQYLENYNQLDILLNNAGMMGKYKEKTRDGFEMQLGINHLGHYILTGLLLPTLQNSSNSRIIHLSSLVAQNANIYYDDIMLEKKNYSAMKGYAQSKLAVLLFALELNKRLFNAGSDIKSIPVHPGISKTSIVDNAKTNPFFKMIAKSSLAGSIMQSSDDGALPQLYAATAPEVEGGKYYGPDGKRQYKGNPTEIPLPKTASNQAEWKKLWKITEEITGFSYL